MTWTSARLRRGAIITPDLGFEISELCHSLSYDRRQSSSHDHYNLTVCEVECHCNPH